MPIDPIDLGIVNMPVVQPSALRQPFPQIVQPFVNEHGVINQSWLQLLIALWNRTGSAPGSSSVTNEILAASEMDQTSVADAEQNAALGLLIHEAVNAEVARLGLDQVLERKIDPLEALLFETPSSTSSSASECCASWVPMTDGAEPPSLMTDGAGNLVFIAYGP